MIDPPLSRLGLILTTIVSELLETNVGTCGALGYEAAWILATGLHPLQPLIFAALYLNL